MWVLNIGNDTLPYPDIPNGENLVQIPNKYIFNSLGLHDFVLDCYPDISEPNIIVDRKGILTAKNKDVDDLNEIALSLMDPN